ncbi:hypothetical protein DACRYDRAFT_76868 [Dacryopinax primogenitus]|uniref:Formate dehydrogenase n=1 Tax=Dacryopinax primogenitus (strain DJM 731) TaxID=1858805 RepID=M5GDB8_DACPD|nr:uncharacterized protein DACRYDRAFT_76868 [Dacryopinax primogenitus]EJU04417.1 hypothetical protein DACRYDRAFT_76868 [Dacryopinax primogenitus]
MKILAVLYKGGKSAVAEPRLLGTIENRLGIASWLKSLGHEFIVTDDKEGPNSVFQRELPDTDILITTPFHPAYLTGDLIRNKAHKLKLALTSGVGSDHVDLNAANEKKIMVAEVTGSNVTSVAEHVIMCMLNLVRNFVPAHEQIEKDQWDVAAIARNAFDLEGKVIGTLGAGRIGQRVLKRLVPFDPKELVYYDYNPLPEAVANELGARHIPDLHQFLGECDVVTVNAPLHEGTRGLINTELLKHFKKGAFIVNTARGAICDRVSIAKALEEGQINGYAGDVWDVQPAPKDHIWRHMKNPLGGGNGMTPHYSGTTLDAQKRYADGTRDILERFFKGEDQIPANLIVADGRYATRSYGERK